MDLDEHPMVGDGLFSLAYFLRLLLVPRSVFFIILGKGSFRYVAPPKPQQLRFGRNFARQNL